MMLLLAIVALGGLSAAIGCCCLAWRLFFKRPTATKSFKPYEEGEILAKPDSPGRTVLKLGGKGRETSFETSSRSDTSDTLATATKGVLQADEVVEDTNRLAVAVQDEV